MGYYYIDYENVQSAGFEGLNRLTEADTVNVLYSVHADTMKIGVVRQILQSKAKIAFHEADIGTPNALDFQLLTMLLYENNDQDDYFIISKDAGFDAAIKMAKRMSHNNIKRYSSIKESLLCVDNAVSEIDANETELLVDTAKKEQVAEAQDVITSFVTKLTVNEMLTPLAQIRKIIADACGEAECKKYEEHIISGLKVSENKNQFYQYFRKQFGDSKGLELYHDLRTRFDVLKSMV